MSFETGCLSMAGRKQLVSVNVDAQSRSQDFAPAFMSLPRAPQLPVPTPFGTRTFKCHYRMGEHLAGNVPLLFVPPPLGVIFYTIGLATDVFSGSIFQCPSFVSLAEGNRAGSPSGCAKIAFIPLGSGDELKSRLWLERAARASGFLKSPPPSMGTTCGTRIPQVKVDEAGERLGLFGFQEGNGFFQESQLYRRLAFGSATQAEVIAWVGSEAEHRGGQRPPGGPPTPQDHFAVTYRNLHTGAVEAVETYPIAPRAASPQAYSNSLWPWLSKSFDLFPNSLSLDLDFSQRIQTSPRDGGEKQIFNKDTRGRSFWLSNLSRLTIGRVEHPSRYKPWDLNFKISTSVEFLWLDAAHTATSLHTQTQNEIHIRGIQLPLVSSVVAHTAAGSVSLGLGLGMGLWNVASQGRSTQLPSHDVVERSSQSLRWPFLLRTELAYNAFVYGDIFAKISITSTHMLFPRIAILEHTQNMDRIVSSGVTLGWYIPTLKPRALALMNKVLQTDPED